MVKSLRFFAVLLPILAMGLPARANPALNSPQATFHTVIKAIQNRDIQLYKKCFSEKALKIGEAMIEKYEKDPDRFWTQLQEIFQGPQSLQVNIQGDKAKGSVTAPQAKGGGIGSIGFIKEGEEWKIRAW